MIKGNFDKKIVPFLKKLRFWWKMMILVKYPDFGQNRDFSRRSRFWSQIQILVENDDFGQKSRFRSEPRFLVENVNNVIMRSAAALRNIKFRSKVQILVENGDFGQKIYILANNNKNLGSFFSKYKINKNTVF